MPLNEPDYLFYLSMNRIPKRPYWHETTTKGRTCICLFAKQLVDKMHWH